VIVARRGEVGEIWVDVNEKVFCSRRSNHGKGRENDFDDFDGLLHPAVDVTFDLGNLTFVGVGVETMRAPALETSNLKEFGSIDHVEGIGEKRV
jgi:hypothetical protein